MDNKQIRQFERNRYYTGKLLTAADFEVEQMYGIQKHRFANEMMFGCGVVCGLGVFCLDDQSIMLDSGVALDGLGREIVVEQTAVRKLSAIAGFEETSGDRLLLGLRYQEEEVHPVYSVRNQVGENRYECNRIHEGWSLFLKNAEDSELGWESKCGFLRSAVFFENREYRVTFRVPAVASCGCAVRIDVEVERLDEMAPAITLDVPLQIPAFYDANGERTLHLHMENAHPDLGEPLVKSWWITAQDAPSHDCVMIAGVDGTNIQIGDRTEGILENFMLQVSIEDNTPDRLIARAIGRVNLEERSGNGRTDYVPLAIIGVQRSKIAYKIESVEENGIKRYIESAVASELRAKYLAYFNQPEVATAQVSAADRAEMDELMFAQEPQCATGTCEIPVYKCKKGDIVYSDEIIHGLGLGNVFVRVGLEYLVDGDDVRGQSRRTIYGDPSLFKDEANAITPARTAVRVNCDRGSFMVAAQLDQDPVYVSILLRWVAFRMPSGDDNMKVKHLVGRSIAPERPSVVLDTRESCVFNVKFKNMEPCTLKYELTEANSGEITSDGIYTAPGKEGIYEIHISCADMPMISTYAYAVVKKKRILDSGKNSAE